MTQFKPDIVIYHHPCADGFGAAWACHTRWPDAQYIEANYGNQPPDVKGKNVLIVDFSYKRDVLLAMAEHANMIVILDHHKTAEADLAEFIVKEDPQESFLEYLSDYMEIRRADPADRVYAHFDMEKCGARLAWEFAHPGDEPPYLIRLIEDRDLWRFTDAFSRPFATWLHTREQSFDEWDMIAQDIEEAHDGAKIGTEAHAMQAYHDQLVYMLSKSPNLHTIGGHTVPCVNCPGELASDVGHALLQRLPEAAFSATHYDDGAKRRFSLRSDDNRTDVSEIAKRFGGGGHRNAAGFQLDIDPVSAPHAPREYHVGDETMAKVFKAAGLTNLSDMQAVLNAVESAFVALDKGTFVPPDLLAAIASIGQVEWGATDPKPATDHAASILKSVEITAQDFGQAEDQPMHGVYVKGTETIVCHTGTSPNSGIHAQAIAGIWNRLAVMAGDA